MHRTIPFGAMPDGYCALRELAVLVRYLCAGSNFLNAQKPPQNTRPIMTDNVIEFVRKRNYLLVKELGQGACGRTVLLKDDVIDELFVCKKYSPYNEAHKQEFFANFLREIKLLHDLYHQNVVRIFQLPYLSREAYWLHTDGVCGWN